LHLLQVYQSKANIETFIENQTC